jgi:hypothetical protein
MHTDATRPAVWVLDAPTAAARGAGVDITNASVGACERPSTSGQPTRWARQTLTTPTGIAQAAAGAKTHSTPSTPWAGTATDIGMIPDGDAYPPAFVQCNTRIDG